MHFISSLHGNIDIWLLRKRRFSTKFFETSQISNIQYASVNRLYLIMKIVHGISLKANVARKIASTERIKLTLFSPLTLCPLRSSLDLF